MATDPPLDPIEWPELRQQHRAIVVVDVVESVRMMQADEAEVIDRWRRFVNEVRIQVLPVHGGRLIKSLGDGLLLVFDVIASAVAAASDMQRRIARYNLGREAASEMRLRVGVHFASIVSDDLDIYGAGVNLCARIATLAEAGEVVVSAEVRDGLVDGLDVQLEDLGECYLKHLKAPIRAYRVGAAVGLGSHADRRGPISDLLPTIAVIPFRPAVAEPQGHLIGDALADAIIAGLSSAASMNVISRLSTAAFRDRRADVSEIAAHLGASYVLSGSLFLSGRKLRISVELANAVTASVVWADAMFGDIGDLFDTDEALVADIVSKVGNAVVQSEVRQAASRSLPTLQSYSLLLGAITLMHRTSLSDFDRARAMLEHLIERQRKYAQPHAWMANWHALRVTQTQYGSPEDDTRRALDHARRALDIDPQCSLALAIDAVLHMNLVRDFDAADRRLSLALEANPNESLAWLFKAVMHGFLGEGVQAEQAGDRALSLSPLHPLRYYYESLAASAALGALNYPKAIDLAQRSLRANRTHPSTYRALAIAQAMSGDTGAAHHTVAQLRQLTPAYTVADFEARSGFGAGPLKAMFADALQSAGMPL